MDNSYYHRFIADDRSYFSLIKKDINKIAEDAGFISARLNEINIILAELTSNLQKYSTGGAEILTTISGTDENSFLEIICMDNGPGIANLSKVLEDGYSSSSTIGHGLGSIKRLSDEFDIFSLQGWGTILLVRVYKTKNRVAQKSKIKFGALVVPKQGEKVSGDGSYIIYNTIRIVFLKRKFNLQPFTKQTLYVLLHSISCYLVTYFIFKNFEGWSGIITRSIAFVVLFTSTAIYLELSPDLASIVQTIKKRLKPGD